MKTTLFILSCLFGVALGAGLVFAGFEMAAYEKTIADREVTTSGDVIDTEVYRLPDGNWTYEFDYAYRFDQEAEITDQGLEDVYTEHAENPMVGEQRYTSTEDGGKYDSQSNARSAMEDNWNEDGSVTVYVDPFFPGDGSLSDATSIVPRLLQYAGALFLFLSLSGMAEKARRVSS